MAVTGTTGAKNTGAVAATTTADADWTSISSVRVSDNVRATATLLASQTEILYLSNLNFGLPSDATVTHIKVMLEGYDTAGTVGINLCQVHQNQTLIGTNVDPGGGLMPNGADAAVNITDTLEAIANWGAAVEALTADDWNESTIGIALRFEAAGADSVNIDHLTVELKYTYELATEELVSGTAPANNGNGVTGGPYGYFPTVVTGTGWTNANNVLASDGNSATFSISGAGVTGTLICRGFNFNLPADAIVTGFQAWVEGSTTNDVGVVTLCQLGRNLTTYGFNNPSLATIPSGADSYTKANASDRATAWTNQPLTREIVNDSAFGVRINFTATSDEDFSIDAITMVCIFTYPQYRGMGAAMSYAVTRRAWIKKKKRLAAS